jgi:cytochrome c oxidase subunit 2
MLVGAAIVFGVVFVLLLAAVLRGRARGRPLERDTGFATGLTITAGAILPLVVLVALFVLTLRTLPATSAPRGPGTFTVEVRGHQWFWEVRYPGHAAVTANEIHIPARTRVRVVVSTVDVAHSLWVPRLNRKIDMIPGRENSVLLEANRPGVYRGQCAEFCGLQHANMAFLVVADDPARFRSWLARESRPAAPPAAAAARRGLDVFLSAGCGGCHAIRGTPARASFGPDLTHLASRTTLAANTIPNDTGTLAAWISDPQHFKPGNKMPALHLAPDDFQPLLTYLQGLR